MRPTVDEALGVDGISVRDEFLTEAQIRALLDCAHLRRERGEYHPAQVGGIQRGQRCEEIRGDFTCWMTPPLLPAEQALAQDLERLRLQLNREAMLGLFELELHYAWDPPGAGYARHVDQPQGRTQRQVPLASHRD